MSQAALQRRLERLKKAVASRQAARPGPVPDPVDFARSVGVEPDPWQAEVLRTSSLRLLLNCSRQSGKSTVAAVLALYVALFRPGSLVLLVSPSQRQSGELFRKVAGYLHQLEPAPILEEDNRLSLQLANTSRVVSLPGSADTVRGFSAPALIILDEAAFVPPEVYTALRPMLATSTRGQLVLMSTPRGRRGSFFEAWANGGPEWERVEIPASKCPRITAAFLEQERAALGEYLFSQEYMCHFANSVDSFFSQTDVAGAVSADVLPLFADASVSATPRASATSADVRPLFSAGGAR